MPHDTQNEQRILNAMERHRGRLRLADAISTTLDQHAAEQADSLAALAMVIERLTAIQIGESYTDWRERQPDPPAEHPSPYAAAMAAELAE